ncbi:MAG TPA: DUF5615 family PIN-like protein [Planctomycetota bacterium]|nr:DUF5615 family PIN-like protein [Planctomycetota bacterium]
MKVLLDACVWGGVRASLAKAGHDALWAGDWKEDPGGEEILPRAAREGRVLVTLDKDFGQLAIVRGRSHAGIVRLVNLSSDEQASVGVAVLERYAAELERGAIVTAERTRVRVRPSE